MFGLKDLAYSNKSIDQEPRERCRRDAGLAAFAAIYKGVEHVDSMEKASLITSASRHDRGLNGGIDLEFDLGLDGLDYPADERISAVVLSLRIATSLVV